MIQSGHSILLRSIISAAFRRIQNVHYAIYTYTIFLRYMKNSLQKNWKILSLIFIIIFTSSTLFQFIDESTLESAIPWHLGLYAAFGYILSFPIFYIINLMNESNVAVERFSILSTTILPFITAFLYILLLAFIGSKRKNSSNK
jgi:hypothetical protein